MTKIATLGSPVRLIAFQLLMKEEQVPDTVRPRQATAKSTIFPSVPGKKVLPSTKGVYLLNLMDGICPGDGGGDYELVDAWSHPRPDGRHAVRFVFCRKEYVRTGELHPDFIAKREELMDSLSGLLSNNTWRTHGFLNPYFDNDQPTGHSVLMLEGDSRASTMDPGGYDTLRVYEGGRDELGQGIGRRVPVTEIAPWLIVADGELFLRESTMPASRLTGLSV